jgi:hypothetical protein
MNAMLKVPSPERRTQHRLRILIADLQASRDRRRVEWDKQATTIAVLQNDVAWLRREVAKHGSRLK